ncbi:MAG: hypothetical protein GC206_01355 [Alphaproteobacteria bacterium]|nr:hypothetical protein [Alphaproteobacteria bacterium]
MSEDAPPRRLPKRDLWLLPLVAAGTLGALGVGAEIGARVIWPEQDHFPCLRADRTNGSMATPNCRSRVKTAEGPWVTNRYNECGMRATGPCEIADRRRPRIVVMGSSTSWGYMVPFEQTWSTRLARDLTERCGKAEYDVQSFVTFADVNGNARMIDDALALQPDLVAFVIAPLDLEQIGDGGFVPPEAATRVVQAQAEDAPESLVGWLRELVSESRLGKIAQHYLYRNPDVYIPAFLTNGDKADFMRAPLSEPWRDRVQAVDDALSYYNERFEEAGVPMMLVYTPQQAQAVLISEDGALPPNVDPTELPDTLERVAEADGVIYADASDAFEQLEDAGDMFYNADGHLNGAGHQLIAEAAKDALVDAMGPAPLCPGGTR